MMSLEERAQLLVPIADFVEEFEQDFKRSLQSDAPVLSHALEHLQLSSGKHIRPIIVGLCAQLCAGQTNEQTLSAALVIELLHTASLIHDDVIDWSDTRRGQPTLNALYSNHQAVLMGDYVLSTAFLELVSREHNPEMLRVVAQAGRNLSIGELMQLSLSKAHTYREEDYYAVVDRKTGALFEASAKLGALSVDASAEQVERCGRLGQLMGRAFQLQDDLFDYDKHQDVGKPTGHDLIEGKVSLPLLYVLNQAAPKERDEIISYLQQPIGSDAIDYLLRIARERGGIDYTERQIQHIHQEAIDLLRSFAPSDTRETLERFITLLGERQK